MHVQEWVNECLSGNFLFEHCDDNYDFSVTNKHKSLRLKLCFNWNGKIGSKVEMGSE